MAECDCGAWTNRRTATSSSRGDRRTSRANGRDARQTRRQMITGSQQTAQLPWPKDCWGRRRNSAQRPESDTSRVRRVGQGSSTHDLRAEQFLCRPRQRADLLRPSTRCWRWSAQSSVRCESAKRAPTLRSCSIHHRRLGGQFVTAWRHWERRQVRYQLVRRQCESRRHCRGSAASERSQRRQQRRFAGRLIAKAFSVIGYRPPRSGLPPAASRQSEAHDGMFVRSRARGCARNHVRHG